MLGSLVTGTTGLIFPMFASYRALVSNDISLIRPWLMYWVVFATLQFAEDVFRPIVRLVPFYGLFKMGALIWLVLPQTQGAVQIYQTRLEPWLRSHNQDIDNFVNSLFSFVNSTPLASILRLIGINLPSPGPNGGAGGPNGGAGAAAAAPGGGGVLDSVLSSFRQTGNPDANLSAYIPAILGGGVAAQSEAGYAAVRNRLMGMVRSLDTSNGASSGAANGASAAASSSASTSGFTSASTAGSTQARSPDSEAFDFVEVPRGTTPGSTEIEREIQQHWK